jgi:ribonuclease VapC
MVIDSSAVFAIVFREPEWDRFARAIIAAPTKFIGAPTVVECRVVALRRTGPELETRVCSVLSELQIGIVEFDETSIELAAEAFRRYGKGRDPAGLHFGDCFSYALAKSLGEPLLYKGGDFARTDIAAAL